MNPYLFVAVGSDLPFVYSDALINY